MLFCLTGGFATGKSRVATWFAARGWVVVCCDQIVHQLYESGQSLSQEIAREFGSDVLTTDGKVNRTRLGEIVFHDQAALQQLHTLVHPRVREIWKHQAIEAVRKGNKTLVVIPLAYETGVVQEFQQVWVVACSKEIQENRLYQRGLDKDQVTCRIAAQWPLQKKIDLADRVIWNNGLWSLTEEQLERIFCCIN